MKTTWTAAFCSLVLILFALPAGAESTAPYAGWQMRDIKALSAQQIDDLRAGRGMGLALAAELNGFPGPRHVLELGEELGLTAQQRGAVEAAFSAMQAEAQRLGREVLQREAQIDRAFRAGAPAPAALRAELAALAAVQGELRFAHLRSHLAVKKLLTAGQVARYNALRGYGGADAASQGGGQGSHDGPRRHGGHGGTGVEVE